MTIAAGTRLGPYEVLSLPGAGGMEEAYRANSLLDLVLNWPAGLGAKK